MQKDWSIWRKKKFCNSDWVVVGEGHFVDFHQGIEEPQIVKTGL